MSSFSGLGGDAHGGLVKMWELAHRSNKKPTVARKRIVKKVVRLPLV